jgi:cell division septum initiation protein DivIVA
MLVDRLEAVINSGTRVPMTSRVALDEREALDVIDLMRTTVPEEIKQARRIQQERDKILSQAQTEANRLITQAQERVDRMVSDDNIRLTAEEKARDLLSEAQHDAEEVRQGADEYAMSMLDRLGAEVHRIDNSVRAAIDAMHTQPRQRGGDEDEE